MFRREVEYKENKMKVHELLTFLNDKYKPVKVYRINDTLTGGTFEQNKLEVDLLNAEVSSYIVYTEHIAIWIK